MSSQWSRGLRSPRGRRSAVLCVTLGGFLGCGSRTGLPPRPPCRVEGETRMCQNDCGAGITICTQGYWSECQVDPVVVSCENTCGTGSLTCKDGEWGDCEVPTAVEACENVCGRGTRTCADGTFGDCEVPPAVLACKSKCGEGTQSCVDGELGPCDAPQPLPPVLQAVVRDFHDLHVDFEPDFSGGHEPGLVESLLGTDDKPVYALEEGESRTTFGKVTFDQWYRDVLTVNVSLPVELPLSRSAGDDRLYVYFDSEFFPIDGLGFGNEGRVHNYHFTLEAHSTFVYQGGETFRFTGDDDLWVFINRQLVIDLGGLHPSLTREVELDQVAEEIGIELGEEVPLHLFFAERKTVESNFNIETSIEDLGRCPE